MAVTNREQQIIALDEAGLGVGEIAARLDLSEFYVGRIVGALCRGLADDRGFAAMMEHGSLRLRKAIQQARAA